MNKKVHDKIWFPYTVALCIAVVLFVFLTHLSSVMNALGIFIGYFNPLFLGCILAYLMNPLAKLFKRTAFKRLHNEKLGWGLSIAMTIAAAVVISLIYALRGLTTGLEHGGIGK